MWVIHTTYLSARCRQVAAYCLLACAALYMLGGLLCLMLGPPPLTLQAGGCVLPAGLCGSVHAGGPPLPKHPEEGAVPQAGGAAASGGGSGGTGEAAGGAEGSTGQL